MTLEKNKTKKKLCQSGMRSFSFPPFPGVGAVGPLAPRTFECPRIGTRQVEGWRPRAPVAWPSAKLATGSLQGAARMQWTNSLLAARRRNVILFFSFTSHSHISFCIIYSLHQYNTHNTIAQRSVVNNCRCDARTAATSSQTLGHRKKNDVSILPLWDDFYFYLAGCHAE